MRSHLSVVLYHSHRGTLCPSLVEHVARASNGELAGRLGRRWVYANHTNLDVRKVFIVHADDHDESWTREALLLLSLPIRCKLTPPRAFQNKLRRAPSRPALSRRQRAKISHFCTHANTALWRQSHLSPFLAQHDVGYPSLCVPDLDKLLPSSLQYRQNGARTCTYLALLRRSDALNGRSERARRKISHTPCAAGLRAVY